MIPQLLAHLNVEHVSLASHSGGVLYALNTLITYPHLLHPKTPFATFFAPWVHHSHTGVLSMSATELLPAPLIGKFGSVARFVNSNIMPVAGFSSGLLNGVKNSLPSSPAVPPVLIDPNAPPQSDSAASDGVLDLHNPEVVEEVRELIMTYVFAESTDGASADAQLFLKRPHTTTWCMPGLPWSDLDSFIPLLEALIEREKQQNDATRKWAVDVYHAESDNMVGEKGGKFFDKCWRAYHGSVAYPGASQLAPTATEQQDKDIEYRSEVVPGTDHNYLMNPAFGASEKWLKRVRAAFSESQEV